MLLEKMIGAGGVGGMDMPEISTGGVSDKLKFW